MSQDDADDELEQEILSVAAQGAEYGFEKGFESAVWYVKGIADNMPDVDLKYSLKKCPVKSARNLWTTWRLRPLRMSLCPRIRQNIRRPPCKEKAHDQG